MILIDAMIEKLNAVVDSYNAELVAAVDMGDMLQADADLLHVPAGSVTIEKVKEGPKEWPANLRKAMKDVIISEDPNEIIRMAEACPVQTETIKHLRIGAKKSPGAKPGILFGFPAGIHLIDMAHLVANCGAGRAVVLG